MKPIANRFLKFSHDLLRQGLTPEKLALCLALGVTLGIFPVLGLTTLLCLSVGLALQVNQPALQSINYVMFPVQLLMLIPFYRAGEWLFHAPRLPLSVDEVNALVQAGPIHAVQILWATTLRAIAIWCLAAPVLGIGVYAASLPLFRRAQAKLV